MGELLHYLINSFSALSVFLPIHVNWNFEINQYLMPIIHGKKWSSNVKLKPAIGYQFDYLFIPSNIGQRLIKSLFLNFSIPYLYLQTVQNVRSWPINVCLWLMDHQKYGGFIHLHFHVSPTVCTIAEKRQSNRHFNSDLYR